MSLYLATLYVNCPSLLDVRSLLYQKYSLFNVRRISLKAIMKNVTLKENIK